MKDSGRFNIASQTTKLLRHCHGALRKSCLLEGPG
jgi:hypothetical protein